MAGVEILNSEIIYETDMHLWLIPIFICIGLCIGMIISIREWVTFGFDSMWLLVIIFCCAIGALFGTIGAVLSEYETDTIHHIEYKVTIDDSVLINEFLDKYEIIDIEGKIYTVVERN